MTSQTGNESLQSFEYRSGPAIPKDHGNTRHSDGSLVGVPDENGSYQGQPPSRILDMPESDPTAAAMTRWLAMDQSL